MALHARYFVSESFRAFRKARWLSLVAVVTIGFVLTLLTCFSVLLWFIHFSITRAEGKMEMVSFVVDEYASPDSAVVLRNSIESLPGIKHAGWISKDSAIHIFRQRYGSELLEAVDDNPLPASFHIALEPSYRSNDSMFVLQEKLHNITGLEEVSYGKEWFPKLKKIRKMFLFITAGIGLITLFAFYWMVSNTIRFTLFARRNMIEIMQFIGATDGFIKIPFYLEGLYTGLLGSILAVCMLFLIYHILSPYIPELLIVGAYAHVFFFGIMAIGIIAATWCSKAALKKYLA